MHRRDFLAAAAMSGLALPAHAFEQEGVRRNPILLLDQPIATLDPHARMDWAARMVRDALYDALARHEGDPATTVPNLAESWTTSDDGLTWTFRLAPRARFANGDPVDAEAARASWVRALQQPGTAWMLRDCLRAEGISAPDPATLRLTLARPLPALLGYLPHVAILNPRQVPADWPGGSLAWLAAHSAGSGPFRIRRHDAGAVVLEAVADHWRGWPMPPGDRPAAITLRVVPDPAARRTAFAKGEADLLPGEPDPATGPAVPVPVLERRRGLTSLVVMMNTATGPTADLNLRRALAYAFPYGDAAPSSPFPSGTPGAQDVPDMPRQDLAIARQYADKLPPDGLDLEYAYLVGDSVAEAAGRALAASAAPLGLRLALVPLPWTGLLARGATPETSPALAALRVTPFSADPDAVASSWASASAGQTWGMHHLRDDVLDKLVADARSDLDERKRLESYQDVQRLIVATQPAIFAGPVERVWAHRGLRGVAPSPVRGGGAVDLWRLHVPA